MRAWFMDSYDGFAKLRLGEASEPQVGAGQVLLDMEFAALNPADAFLAEGLYPARPQFPHVLGRDGVGVIAAVGAGVDNLRVGDRVGILRGEAGVTAWGTLAERTVVSADSVTSVPADWSAAEMASAPLVFITAWQALTQWSEPACPPAPGTTVLVTGASGGVGAASVLLAKAMGLTVVALSRSEGKRARLQQLGADFTFDPAHPWLKKAIWDALAPRKVDLAIDNVGGALFSQIVAVLGDRGCISVVGRSAGPVPEFNTATLFFRRNRIGGVNFNDYSPIKAKEIWARIVATLDQTRQRPVVDRIFPFAEAKAAFARLAEGPMGKVLIALK